LTTQSRGQLNGPEIPFETERASMMNLAAAGLCGRAERDGECRSGGGADLIVRSATWVEVELVVNAATVATAPADAAGDATLASR
jgi:hypothetical protein